MQIIYSKPRNEAWQSFFKKGIQTYDNHLKEKRRKHLEKLAL